MVLFMEPIESVCVKVYLKPKFFAEVCELAQKSGKRGIGLKNYKLKEHGFANQTIPNTKGIAKFFKMCALAWRDAEVERAHASLTLEQEKRALAKKEEDLKKRGLI